MKIAISGKGGVGKTTIMALLANQFKKEGKEVLIIDADPSPHMAQTLGIKDIDKIEYSIAMVTLQWCSSNDDAFGKRHIFSDRGDRSRFDAFEQAVQEAYDDEQKARRS